MYCALTCNFFDHSLTITDEEYDAHKASVWCERDGLRYHMCNRMARSVRRGPATHCNTLQYAATRMCSVSLIEYETLQHTATLPIICAARPCNTLQHTCAASVWLYMRDCNTLKEAATHCNTHVRSQYDCMRGPSSNQTDTDTRRHKFRDIDTDTNTDTDTDHSEWKQDREHTQEREREWVREENTPTHCRTDTGT